LDAIREMVRVSKHDIIVAFPYWKQWSLCDNLFDRYIYLKNGERKGWLKEHIENWLPDEILIKKIKNEFSNYNIYEKMNWNIFLTIFVVYIEWVRFLWYLLTLTSYMVRYLPINFDSKYGIRKFLIITK
jgi:hypothetical protein